MSDTITLTRYQPQVTESRPAQPPVAPAQADTLLGGLGTFGTYTVQRALALCALHETLPACCSLDNAASLPSSILLPDGRRLDFPVTPDAHLHLHTRDRRTELRQHTLLAARYEGDGQAPGLLRGLSVAGTYSQGGHGGSAQPLLSLIDLDLHIGRVRSHLRSALQRAARPRTGATGGLTALLAREAPAQSRPFVLVVAGGAGSFGAAAALFAGYLFRQEAQRLGLERPVTWLLLAGPHAFQGLTPRTQINYGATIQALYHLARYGIQRSGIDGQTITEAAPPYDRVWLIDDPQLPADGVRVSEAELETFSWRVGAAARALLDPTIRAVYLDHVANQESAGTTDWPGFGTLQIGLGGFEPSLLVRQVQADLATRRASVLADLLATAA